MRARHFRYVFAPSKKHSSHIWSYLGVLAELSNRIQTFEEKVNITSLDEMGGRPSEGESFIKRPLLSITIIPYKSFPSQTFGYFQGGRVVQNPDQRVHCDVFLKKIEFTFHNVLKFIDSKLQFIVENVFVIVCIQYNIQMFLEFRY